MDYYANEVAEILHEMNRLYVLLLDTQQWELSDFDKFSIALCLDRLMGVRNRSISGLECACSKHACNDVDFRIDMNKRELKGVRSEYQKIATKGPLNGF